MLSYLIAGVLLVGLAAAPNLSAQGFAGLGSSPSAAYAELELNKGRKGFLGPDLGCSVEKLAGTWMYKGEARYLSNLTEVFPDFPAELAGLLVPRVGIVVIDEQGNGTFLEDFSIGLRGPGQTFAADFAQFADIRVEVFPDCSAFTALFEQGNGRRDPTLLHGVWKRNARGFCVGSRARVATKPRPVSADDDPEEDRCLRLRAGGEGGPKFSGSGFHQRYCQAARGGAWRATPRRC